MKNRCVSRAGPSPPTLGLLLSLLFLFLILAGPGQFFCKGDLLQVQCPGCGDSPEKRGDFSSEKYVKMGVKPGLIMFNQQKMKIYTMIQWELSNS